MGTLVTNWKTTLGGVIAIFCLVGSQLGWLNMQQSAEIGTLAVSFGLIASKDHNK